MHDPADFDYERDDYFGAVEGAENYIVEYNPEDDIDQMDIDNITF